jgi:FMN phosphatase YigB (HAD superfamily)
VSTPCCRRATSQARRLCDSENWGVIAPLSSETCGPSPYPARLVSLNSVLARDGRSVGDNQGVIEAITFDFWNTIAQVPPGTMPEARRRAVAAACEEAGLEVEPALLAARLDEVRLRWERSWGEGVHLHPSEGAEMLVRALGAEEEGGEAVAEAFLGAIREVELELAPDLHPALAALRERDLRLGIVCDVGFSGGAQLRDLLDREGLLDHFDGWSFSDETGHYKPAPQPFEAALDSLGARPEEAMHVGDLRRTDIAGAAALGMRTVRYRGMHDDEEVGVEADFVVDSHLELVGLIE